MLHPLYNEVFDWWMISKIVKSTNVSNTDRSATSDNRCHCNYDVINAQVAMKRTGWPHVLEMISIFLGSGKSEKNRALNLLEFDVKGP